MKKPSSIEKNYQVFYFHKDMIEKINIPIFPLNGAILFPETNLPLNIFEEKYIDMVDFALKNNREIGMIQTNNKKELYSVGCIGKINSFEEMEDGRYVINLYGKNLFSLFNEISTKNKFKIITASVLPNKYDNTGLDQSSIVLLLEYYESYIKKINQDINIDFLKKIKNEQLIRFIAMSSPFTVAEKQMLLEIVELNKLLKNLIALIELYLEQEKGSPLIN